MFKVETGILEEITDKIEQDLMERKEVQNLTPALQACRESYEDSSYGSNYLAAFDVMNFARELDELDGLNTVNVKIIKKSSKKVQEEFFVAGTFASDNFKKVKDKKFNFYIPINLNVLTDNRKVVLDALHDSVKFLDAKYVVKVENTKDAEFVVVENSFTADDAVLCFIHEDALFENGNADTLSLCIVRENK